MKEKRNAYSSLVGKPGGGRPLRFPGRRSENFQMDPKAVAWNGVDWFHLAHDGEQWRALVTF
jgi:hypothetical protein